VLVLHLQHGTTGHKGILPSVGGPPVQKPGVHLLAFQRPLGHVAKLAMPAARPSRIKHTLEYLAQQSRTTASERTALVD
jgi:hypothetical protein